MRILNVTAQKPDSTGSGVYLAQLVRCMDASGHATAVVCGVDRDDVVRSLPESTQVFAVRFDTPELPFHVCGMSDSMPYPSTRYRDLTCDMVQAFISAFRSMLEKAQREFKPDIVICHHLYLVASIVREVMPDTPLGVVCHSTDLRQMASHQLERQRILEAMQAVDVVFALHAEQARSIHQAYGLDPELIHVIGTGYDAREFNASGRVVAGGAHAVGIAYVGKVCRQKGIASLVRALGSVRAPAHGLKVTLVGGHSDEADYQRIASMARECPWPIDLPGRLSNSELVRAYQASDIFVLPSFYEGLPLVTIEALACGCKVVMTDLPGIRPWMEQNAPQADVSWVEPPRMAGVGEPMSEDLPAFEQRLARALEEALATPPRPCDMSDLSWEKLTERMVGVMEGPGKREGGA